MAVASTRTRDWFGARDLACLGSGAVGFRVRLASRVGEVEMNRCARIVLGMSGSFDMVCLAVGRELIEAVGAQDCTRVVSLLQRSLYHVNITPSVK